VAYQNLGTPRFYVSVLQWLKSLGKLITVDGFGDPNSTEIVNYLNNFDNLLEFVDIIPDKQTTINVPTASTQFIHYKAPDLNFKSIMPEKKNFMMVLGHTFGNESVSCRVREEGGIHSLMCDDNYVNFDQHKPHFNGFSIATGNDAHDNAGQIMSFLIVVFTPHTDYKFSSLLYGTYYDMPHSPELNLKMSRSMDGVERIRTAGGNDFVNHKYTKPSLWGRAPAWELTTGDMTADEMKLSKTGRRMWDLNFNYLSKSDLLPEVSTANWADSYSSESASSGKMLLDGDNFFAQVIHKTNGGQLPFVFQPDNNNKSPDQFAICKLDMNNFEFKQVANGVYNIKLKIREVW